MNILQKLAVLVFGTALGVSVQAADWTNLAKTGNEQVFGEKCGMCHRASGMGTTLLSRRLDPEQALLENRRDLQPVFIETVVRSGFNNMFPVSRGEVSDEQLQQIIAHLTRENAK
jgi:cytochrome c5